MSWDKGITYKDAYKISKDRYEELLEENRKLKLHIDAKDKAYMSLLKDYEEIKGEKEKLKSEIEERLNALRNLSIN